MSGSELERETLRKLRRMIDDGGYDLGDKLPAERELAESMGVSRRVLRSVFTVLESEGKVWRGVGQGTFVGPKSVETHRDVEQFVQAANPTGVIEARLTLEPLAARFAAQRANSEHLSRLKRAAEETGRARGFDEYDDWDEQFHLAAVDATENAVFMAMFEVIRTVWNRVSWGQSRTRTFTAEWQRIYARQHRAIAEAIESRDMDRAENLMLEHWQTVRSNVVRDPAG